MGRIIFVLSLSLSILFAGAADAQNDKKVYFLNSSGYLFPTIAGADHFLIISPPDTSVDKDLFIVTGYYTDGHVMFKANASSNKLKEMYKDPRGFFKPFLQGPCVSFYPDGHKKSIGMYENGEPVGDETVYYPNGKLYTVKSFLKEDKWLYKECRDSTGKVLVENGNGKGLKFMDDGFKNYIEGEVINGLEEGEWFGKQDNEEVVAECRHGDVVSYATVDSLGNKTYGTVEVLPKFNGNDTSFTNFLIHNVHYPPDAREKGIQGRVIITFVVKEDGTLDDIRIKKSVGAALDDEAVRVIKLSSPWKPGMHKGKPVRVAYSVPVSFQLAND